MAKGRCRESIGSNEEVQKSFQKIQLDTHFGCQLTVRYACILFVGDGAVYSIVDEEFDNTNFDHGVEVRVYGRGHDWNQMPLY